MPSNRDPITVRLYLDVTFDQHMGDAGGTAEALDTLLATAMSTPGVLSDFGDVEVESFTELPAAEVVAREIVNALVTNNGRDAKVVVQEILEQSCLRKGPGSK